MRKKYIILSNILFLTLLLFIILLRPYSYITAYAVDSEYTNVLIDLRKDDTFDVNDYPENNDDNSLKVIQIAESDDKELLVYVYQPARTTRKLNATHINMSTETGDNFSPRRYTLKLVSTVNVFCKYVVEGFITSSDSVRLYDIVSISRAYDSSIDEVEAEEVAFEVGKLYTVYSSEGNTIYNCKEMQVVNITGFFAGSVRYSNGFVLYGNDACDSWFIAFKTDWDIDKLYEADVCFSSQTYTCSNDLFFEKIDLGDKVEDTVTLYHDEYAQNPADKWWGKKRVWKRIQTAEEYCQSTDLTDEVESTVSNMDFVLSFKETAYLYQTYIDATGAYSGFYESKTLISDVSILRLKFETDGKVYNLGVVSNTFTPDDVPDNTATDQSAIDGPIEKLKEFFKNINEFFKDINENLENVGRVITGILIVIIAIILLILTFKVVKFIVNLFKNGK